MATLYVDYYTPIKLGCVDGVRREVILCLSESTLIVPTECNDPDGNTYVGAFIPATICQWLGSGDCGKKFFYTFAYDSALLVDQNIPLQTSDITGVFCRGCITDYFDYQIGDEVEVVDIAGVQTLVTQHGCEYPLAASAQELLQVTDTPSVDLTIDAVLPQTLSADVNVSADVGNIIEIHADGLYADETPQVPQQPMTVTDTSTVDLTIGGAIPQDLSAVVKVSADVGNIVEIHADGLYADETPQVPQVPTAVTDTSSIDLTIGGTIPQTLSGVVKVSADAGNTVSIHADGVYAAESLLAVTDTTSVDLTISGTLPQTLSGAVKVSATGGNTVTVNADGIYVPAGAQTPFAVTDTSTIDLTVGGTIPQTLSGDVKISADVGNIVSAHADGIYATGGGTQQPTLVSDTSSINLTIGGTIPQTLSADVTLSPDSGNMVESRANGLFVASAIVGTVIQMFATTAPTGYLLLAGGTIGSAASGGTLRANADTVTLYTALWTNLADTQAPVSGGRGASAAADFAANKTLTVPDMRQKFPMGQAASGTGVILGSVGGTIDHTHSTPAHFHGMGAGADLNIDFSGGGQNTALQNTNHGHTFSGTTSGQSNDHTHNPAQGTGEFLYINNGGSGAANLIGSLGGMYYQNRTGGTSNDHTHTYSGTTDLNNASHSHIQTAHIHPAGSFLGSIGLVTGGVNGNAAMTSGLNNPPFITLNFFIKY